MSERGTADLVSGALLTLGLLAGIVQVAFRPFLLGPAALLAVLIGVALSGRYRRLGLVAMFVIATLFVVGAAITVWYSRPLY